MGASFRELVFKLGKIANRFLSKATSGFSALHCDGGSVRRHDRFDNRQAQSGASHLIHPRFVRAIESLKEKSFLCRWAQHIKLMLEPPPKTLPVSSGMACPLRTRIGLRDEVPITVAPDVQVPLIRFNDAGNVVVTARLEQQDADVRVCGQTTRDN